MREKKIVVFITDIKQVIQFCTSALQVQLTPETKTHLTFREAA